jgi:hypothetical protein
LEIEHHTGVDMNQLLGASLLAVLLLSQPVAIAAPWDHRPGLQAPDRRLPPRQPYGKREQRPPLPPHPGYAGRLTEEERRELRRDVDRANREIYRRRFERR